MHESKLIEALQCLSSSQIKEFGAYLQSPLHNRQEELQSLYAYLVRSHPAYDVPRIRKERVLKALGKDYELNEKKLAQWMSQLLRLMEEFLCEPRISDPGPERYRDLLDWYHENGLEKHYRTVLGRLERSLADQPFRDSRYYLSDYLHLRQIYDHSNPDKRAFNPSLQDAADALDRFYLLEKLRYTCEMVNFERTLNIRYELHFSTEILQALEGHPFLDVPAISVYHRLLQILTDLDNVAAYYSLKTLLGEKPDLLPAQEVKHLYDLLLNFCNWRVSRKNDETFQREYFLLNQELLDRGLLLEHKQLSPWRYSNLVTIALRLGEDSWAEKFMEEYKGKLPAEHRENLYLYKTGQLHYHRKAYSRAQQALIQVDQKDPLLSLSVRNLFARIYWETGETELLLNHLEAYRVYLLRQDLLKEEVHLQVRNFIDFTRKMARLPDFEKAKLEKLREELPPPKEVLHHDWLVEQFNRRLQDQS